jgi:hypothetical protein
LLSFPATSQRIHGFPVCELSGGREAAAKLAEDTAAASAASIFVPAFPQPPTALPAKRLLALMELMDGTKSIDAISAAFLLSDAEVMAAVACLNFVANPALQNTISILHK